MTDETDNSRRSLAPFIYAAGVATGATTGFLAAHPALWAWINPAIICGDVCVYTFFIWLFWPDFKAQWKVRLNRIRGQVGFRWQSDETKSKLRVI